MNNNIQISEIIWRGINIRISFTPGYINTVKEIYGFSMAHLEITSNNQELPITETGYKSHFISAEIIEAGGGPVSYVRAWLDHEAQSPSWIKKEEAAKQMSLF